MTQYDMSLDLPVLAVYLVMLGLYFLACYAVGRYWLLARGRSLTTGWIVSFFLTPLVGLLVAMFLEPDRTVLKSAAETLHQAFQETYREVDQRLHAHS